MAPGEWMKRFGLGRFLRVERGAPRRGPIIHVLLIDGTLSSLEAGRETNVGRILRLVDEARKQGERPVALCYEAGIQWRGFGSLVDVIAGVGLEEQILRGYVHLASRWRPGDRVFLFGYSRGAFAARSLAGMIGRVGLLRGEHALERTVRAAWRLYRNRADAAPERIRNFRRAFCHDAMRIDFLGVFDTVEAIGIRLPLLWRLCPVEHAFHDPHPAPVVREARHALALDETRVAFEPVLWRAEPGRAAHVVQMWFPGAHGDVGGQLGGFEAARPLANIPLFWMLAEAERHGLPLPADWRARLPVDRSAPAAGSWRGIGRLFLLRRRRIVGADISERVHPAALGRWVRARLRRPLETLVDANAEPAFASGGPGPGVRGGVCAATAGAIGNAPANGGRDSAAAEAR